VEQARQLVRTLFSRRIRGRATDRLRQSSAGLLLVRAIHRRREIAMRLALGARAGVLLRQAIL